ERDRLHRAGEELREHLDRLFALLPPRKRPDRLQRDQLGDRRGRLPLQAADHARHLGLHRVPEQHAERVAALLDPAEERVDPLAFGGAGWGPVVVRLQGVAGSSETWMPAIELLAEKYTVVAPDLIGHGESAKPRGDYSLGAFASGIRDLLQAIGHERATIVGHSLGGGIAMQLAYQFPERCERLVLVSSGGLGREVNFLLRAATLPGSEWVIPLLASQRVLDAGAFIGRAIGRTGLRAGSDLEELWRALASLHDAGARQAFVYTLRSIIDSGGQRVSAR